MTVEENLIMGTLKADAKKQRRATMAHVFELFPRLKERRKQLAGTLSGGEQQMLAIGRGLMGLPRLMMFDEPSLGLAPILVQDIFRIFKTDQWRRGHHSPGGAECQADVGHVPPRLCP